MQRHKQHHTSESTAERRQLPPFPWSTGQAAQFLATTERRLSDLDRRAKLKPRPEQFAGRRRWYPDHVRAAARLLELTQEQLDAVLGSIAEEGR